MPALTRSRRPDFLPFPSFLALAVAMLGMTSTSAHAQRVTRHFGYGMDAFGSPELVGYREDGSEGMRIRLQGESPSVGPGELCALVLENRGATRPVRIVDPEGAHRVKFEIPGNRDLLVGHEGFVLVPRREHARAAALDLVFLDMRGSQLATVEVEGVELRSLEPSGEGAWIAELFDLDTREQLVSAYDRKGKELWTVEHGGWMLLDAALHPGLERAALLTLDEELSTTTLRLLDGLGAVQLERPVVGGQWLSFGPEQLLVAGAQSLEVLDLVDGSTLWSLDPGRSLLPGRAADIGIDGTTVHVLTRPLVHGVPEGVGEWLRVKLENGVATEQPGALLPPQLSSCEGVIQLHEGTDGALGVLTVEGLTLLP